MTKYIGILTSGGDSPGLNAAIRGVGKAALGHHGMHIIGFRDGFRGLMENRTAPLDGGQLSGILTTGGTILGTSRDKPHKMPVGGKILDMADAIVGNYHDNHLDCLVCLGGGGTAKNALRLKQKGLNVITLPKTIDNDVFGTDITFGFDTALGIATEAIDRLHSTAHSHHRIIVVEIMGHRAGWLALGAGIAGGADVILLPEIPHDVESVAEAIRERARGGKPFSIVAVAEGAVSKQEVAALSEHAKKPAKGKANRKADRRTLDDAEADAAAILYADRTLRLARKLERLTGLDARPTILGHLQRGGAPSAADRILATRLGTACADLIAKGTYGVMVAAKGEDTRPVKLEDVAGKVKTVPPDHPLILSARRVGTNFGD
ncbi:MAG: ATP-dependent 6-phosphofructokinase [Rhodocyclaceae bacterium]|nr:ATP-dependent 6-phosphofructokinase [Rhodocyclaceae bacterium]